MKRRTNDMDGPLGSARVSVRDRIDTLDSQISDRHKDHIYLATNEVKPYVEFHDRQESQISDFNLNNSRMMGNLPMNRQ